MAPHTSAFSASPTSPTSPPPTSSLSHPSPGSPRRSAAHRLRINPSSETGDSRHTTIPRDQSAASDASDSSPVIPTPRTSFLSSSRDSNADEDDNASTLVASPFRPSSPYLYSPTPAQIATCVPPRSHKFASASPQMSQYPPRSDSFHAPKNAVSAFPGSEQRRPLIDFVTNEWSKSSHRAASFDSDDSYANYPFEREKYDPPHLPEWVKRLLRVQVPRRVQRYLGGYLIFLLALWFGWLYWLQPAWQHEKALDESANIANSAKGQAFGVNMRPSFADMVHFKQLDAEYLPSASNPERRLVFVGDVHGCKDERTWCQINM